MSNMEIRTYGSTGLQVSVLAYGAMGIAADPGLRAGVAPSLLAALEQGVNLIDTARVYPDSERIIRATLASWRGPRPIVSTKLRSSSRDAYRFHQPLRNAYTPQSMRDSVDESLSALGTDCLDIVHLHQWHAPWIEEPEWLDTLQALRREGKLRAMAISVQDHEHDAALEAIGRHLVDGIQLIFNLFESRPMNGILPLCEQRGKGVIVRCALDSGGLSGELGEDGFRQRRFLQHAPHAEYDRRTGALRRQFVPEPAQDLAELAIRFAITPTAVSAVTLGMNDTGQVASAVRAIQKGPLPAEVMETIRRQHVWTKNFYERLA